MHTKAGPSGSDDSAGASQAGIPLAAPGRLPWSTKVFYASGSIGNGIKKAGLALFLMIYYNQVVGLPAALVSLALSIALVVDALVDPIVGQVSDNFHSRWGRRHPFMYGSILPVSIGFAMLWMAPVGWSDSALFFYLLALVVIVRIFDTFFEVPAAALLAEMTTDYDERSAILSLRYIFGICGAHLMMFAAYRYFFVTSSDDPSGALASAGYVQYGIVAGIIIFITILATCLGTHKQIPNLHRPRRRRLTPMASIREIGATLNNTSFMALMAGGILLAGYKGATSALSFYFSIYFWELVREQISILVLADLAGSLAGALVATWIGRRLGKRRAAVTALFVAVCAFAVPLSLRLLGLMPENHAPELFPILLGAKFVNEMAGMVASIMLSAMTVDLVEDSMVKTGRRSEGLLLAADNLLQKAVAAIGVLASGVILGLISFPERARPGSVAPEVLSSLGVIVLIWVTLFVGGAILFLRRYRIDRDSHASNVEILRKRQVENGDG